MSEEFRPGQAAQGVRAVWIIGGLVIAFIIAFVVLLALFQDDCTKGFDRSAQWEIIYSMIGGTVADPWCR